MGKTKKIKKRAADWVDPVSMNLVLMALMPENRLIMRVAIATGLRISDVLALRRKQLYDKNGRLRHRMTVTESKTDKKRRVYLPDKLLQEMALNAGDIYVFEHRQRADRHKTRQAVSKDLVRARTILRIPKLRVSAHSARKIYAVDYAADHTAEQTQRELNHTDPMVTMIYTMSKQLTERKLGGKG